MLICLGHTLFYILLIIQPNKENTQEVKQSRSKVQSMPIAVLECLVADTVLGNADIISDFKYLPYPPITKLYSLAIKETSRKLFHQILVL